MNPPRLTFVAGHRGLLGQALVRRLAREDADVVTVGREALDLRDEAATRAWFEAARPQDVYLAAARTGGIQAHLDAPTGFLLDNLRIQNSVIAAALETGVERLMFVASSAVYPRDAPQPFTEANLMSGPLEPSHETYAMAKLAGIRLCEAIRAEHGRAFLSALPTNLYGTGEHHDARAAHVMPALIRRFHEAVAAGAGELVLWGTGLARREFLHVDDAADALVLLMEAHRAPGPVNVGSGEDVSILELAGLIAREAGFRGAILTDPAKPDGAPRKLLDIGVLRGLGWAPSIPLAEGIARACAAFRRGLAA